MENKPKVLLIATLDTKATEARFIREQLEANGVEVVHMDPSIRQEITPAAEIPPSEVAAGAGKTIQQVRDLNHEGKCQEAMTAGAIKVAQALHARSPLSGIIAIGGSMGSALGSAVLQTFPYGLPKVLVSTMASGFTRPFVGARDIIMFNPVTDIAGLNTITRTVFSNAAIATAAMAKAYKPYTREPRPVVAMGTLGTIDRCTVRVRKKLEEKGFEVLVFHTLGTGGMALDQFVAERDSVVAVVDTSVNEHNDFLNNGLTSAGPDRSKAALKKGIPVIFAPGNADFMVSGPIDIARQQFPGKRYHLHNSALTAVRTEAEELRKLAKHLGGLVAEAKGPVSFFVPLKGFSHHDSPQGHLHDPSLCPVFLDGVKASMPRSVNVAEFDCHINDEQFADALVDEVVRLVEQQKATVG
ncbi:MAG TPA: Tm-1-like ATP-binding domain-containing protein [Pusillimonas sp.]|uniref:Tm-1-like ATP-binding domain-containing protein n=1 Tax=unclassified Pusillimonas TaxID=2640016 RepID=UPI0026196D25|nr:MULTISPECIES: Tm-1-like ATP-binding domain-containing protein [unclassified Pusillimonas]HLU19921.1 Tm-1-like ATP-binding domain-containing protein [Pusillimonas sp.]